MGIALLLTLQFVRMDSCGMSTQNLARVCSYALLQLKEGRSWDQSFRSLLVRRVSAQLLVDCLLHSVPAVVSEGGLSLLGV